MDRGRNILAIQRYLNFKGILNERGQSVVTTIEVFKNDISVYKDSEIKIFFTENDYSAKELSFYEIEYTPLFEALGKHLAVNHHFQCFDFDKNKLIVTGLENSAFRIEIY